MAMCISKDNIENDTRDVRKRDDLMCIFWYCKANKPSWLLQDVDNSLWCKELLSWRKQIKEGKMMIVKENMKEYPHICEDRGYWGLNIQYTDPNLAFPDPLSMLLFGWMCAGHTYWFPDMKTRDQSLRLLTSS
jgi:hypothetical protein